ncbi:hypothetical protein ACVRZA_05255 [Streptococcus halotolerans]
MKMQFFFGRELQGRYASSENFSTFQTIDIGHLIDDHFTFGWLTNPDKYLASEVKHYLESVTKAIMKK